MKKIYSVMILVLALVLMPLNASAEILHFDPAHCEISFTGAPEGTAYLDILIKMPADDENYTDFNGDIPFYGNADENTSDCEELDIDENSEIAQYSEGGYVSLTLHHKHASDYAIDAENGTAALDMESSDSNSCDFIDLYQKYGEYKAAYVDAEGHILGVTGLSERKFSRQTPYSFTAEGEHLIFHQHGVHPAVISVTVGAIGLFLISLPLIVTYIMHKRRK